MRGVVAPEQASDWQDEQRLTSGAWQPIEEVPIRSHVARVAVALSAVATICQDIVEGVVEGRAVVRVDVQQRRVSAQDEVPTDTVDGRLGRSTPVPDRGNTAAGPKRSRTLRLCCAHARR